MPRAVIVHHLAQAKAVLEVAESMGIDVQLWSAPGAAASAGVGYLQALGEAAGQDLVIDCGDDAGLVMAALRTGCLKLAFSGSDETGERLSQMAAAAGAHLLTTPAGTGAGFPLDLSPDDDEAAIRLGLPPLLRA